MALMGCYYKLVQVYADMQRVDGDFVPSALEAVQDAIEHTENEIDRLYKVDYPEYFAK